MEERSRESAEPRKPRIALMYHFMYPDDVVSAHHYHDLACGLVERGWEVEALPCNRGCRDEKARYKSSETIAGVEYRRIWRPKFRQSRYLGRLLNSAWVILAWARVALRRSPRRPDVVLIGTDPAFAVIAAILIKRLSRGKIRVAHWCFDLHPEASLVSGTFPADSLAYRVARSACAIGYRHCDLVVDIGPKMKERLQTYDHRIAEATITPWALSEPEQVTSIDPAARRELFGDCALGLLYSGNYGEAHDAEDILRLARALRDEPEIRFCFAVRGNRAGRLRALVSEYDSNITFAEFAPPEDLERRLSAADIHLCSLREEWSGIAVPSKFFGSLASGRPVLYSGNSDSDIACWIRQFEIGWSLSDEVLADLRSTLRLMVREPRRLLALQQSAHVAYSERFSRETMIDIWNEKLTSLMS